VSTAPPPALRLSDEQRAAVEHDAGPLIVLAGPGTGKTRVITARVAHLVREKGADPARVLAVTFTNKAAGELKERLGSLLPAGQAQTVTACTLHAYGVRLLHRFGDILGLPSEIEILDEAQQRRLARELIRANHLYRASIGRGIDHAVTHALDVAHELVSAGIAPAEALRRADAALADLGSDGSPEAKARRAELSIAREGVELARLLDEACLDRGAARFDDLIAWPMLLMRRSETVAAIVRHECRHVVVDEFQDLNATQIEWLGLLCPPRSRPDLCVVGDDDQSIYAFRGADERAFDRIAAAWPDTTTLRLTTNYRSGPAVIAASNAIIANAGHRFDNSKFGVPPSTRPDAPALSSVELVRLSSDTRAGETAAAMIRAQLDADPAIDLSTIAVIARSGAELLRCAGALEAAGVPYTSSVRDASRDDPGVRAVLAWAALVVDPTRTWAARAVLTRPPFSIDAATLGTLEHRYRQQRAWANENPGEEEPGPFVAWLSAHAPAGFEEPLRRAAEVERSIADTAANDTADHAVMHAVRVSGVAHAEALPPRERAARVRALVALVRFTRERLTRLDEPRGLRELLAYIDDLPEKEKGFAQTPADRLQAGEQAAEEPGVRLLTAHASKGLEFDTVYLLRCTSPHGFPSPKTDPPALPEGVADPDPLGRDARARVDDEERRIFFVALTRAERRAVLLGKIPKKSSAINFAVELRSALGADLAEHEEADVVPPDALADTLTSEEIESGLATQRAAVLAGARRAARRDAARALDDAEHAEAPDDALADRLRRAADRLALIRCLERTGQAPRWAGGAGLAEEAARLAERLRPDGAPGDIFPGVTGPMSLSYTHLKQYLACPRCYYLEHVQGLPVAPTDAIHVGKAVHRALQVYAAAWAEADNEGRPTPGWDQLEQETRRWFFREWPRDQELDHEQLVRAVAMARTFWEHLHPENAHVTHIEQQFSFSFPVDGVAHTIRGSIDRIDRHPSGSVRLIDYKTGFPTKKLLQPEKIDLQMAIYAMALPALNIDPGPGATAEYWMLASGEVGTIPLADLNLAKVRETITNAVRGMAAGNWPKGRECSGLCEFLDEPGD
jgi:DNA helicase-2/ATP-dependent DNA helicase PcrA